MVGDAKLHIVREGPHGILDSHAEEFNEALLDFLLELR
jgi:pimeloyl-ACP methyl ester carboxylesterase